ncbi:MAG: hypothetical protein M1819_005861 [Sarea resinae]|nr:MAG: hypothetical protein M1819_005861 [Sarea resinae]
MRGQRLMQGPPPLLLFAAVGCVLLFLIVSFEWYYHGEGSSVELHFPSRETSGTYSTGGPKSTRFEETINNATLGFGKILVVNLPERTDHRDALTLISGLTNIHLDWIDGIWGKDIPDKALPLGANRELMGNGNLGSWRAHMNAIQAVVSQNLSSALILEDDVDWDVRLKSQLLDFARGSRALVQPLKGSNTFADPTFQSRDSDSNIKALDHELDDKSAATQPPSISPYGDNWDVLWLGHCGVRFPAPSQNIPKGRYLILNDDTVPGSDHIVSLSEEFRTKYVNKTRIVHHAMGPICTFGYAVTQAGAREILYELSVKEMRGAFDNIMANFCDRHTCLTSQPQLFSHHRPPGPVSKDSDINDGATGVREKGYTENVQWSARMNVEGLLKGETVFEDQFLS